MTSDVGWCEFAGRAASRLLAPYLHGESVTLQASPFKICWCGKEKKERSETKANEQTNTESFHSALLIVSHWKR